MPAPPADGTAPSRAAPPASPPTAATPWGAAGSAALHDVLRQLGPRVRRGAPPRSELPPCPSGLPALDHLLGGGFPRGGLSEIAGPASSGRTSLALQLLARATGAGEVTAVVDVADAFDPPSAEAAGVELERVLWVRAPGLREAWRSLHALLRTGGFALVLVDLGAAAAACRPRVWPRLRRELAATDTALVLLGDTRAAHTFADLALEMGAARARFEGSPSGLGGWLLRGLEGQAVLVRSHTAAADRSLAAAWPPQRAEPPARAPLRRSVG